MTMPVNYSAVIADLQEKREAIDKCIQTLLSMSTGVSVHTDPVDDDEAAQRREKFNPTKRGPMVKSAVRSDVAVPAETYETSGMGTRAAIIQAVGESPRTGPEIADRATTLDASVSRSNVSALIIYLLKTGVLHKDDQLKLHLVKNGKIQGV